MQDWAKYRASDGRSETQSSELEQFVGNLLNFLQCVHCILLDERLPSKSNVPNEYRIDAADNGRHEVGIIEVER